MSKKIVFIVAPIALILIYLTSCKKTELSAQRLGQRSIALESSAPLHGRFQDSVSISSWGHLNFLSSENLNDYMIFVRSHTHRQVRTYLDSIGFVSLGTIRFSNSRLDSAITEWEAGFYALDTTGIVQFKNLLIRPVDEIDSLSLSHYFVLVLRSDYLTATTHSYLAAGTYNPETMNKYATYPNDEGEITASLPELMTISPVGHSDTEANGWPKGWDHPIFGNGPTPLPGYSCDEFCHIDPGTAREVCTHDNFISPAHYFFGIKTKKELWDTDLPGKCPR